MRRCMASCSLLGAHAQSPLVYECLHTHPSICFTPARPYHRYRILSQPFGPLHCTCPGPPPAFHSSPNRLPGATAVVGGWRAGTSWPECSTFRQNITMNATLAVLNTLLKGMQYTVPSSTLPKPDHVYLGSIPRLPSLPSSWERGPPPPPRTVM